ncbi:hypothetical protein NCAST_34_03160 [Nocardia asteroides NBRC 15531]|uniref:TTHB210-like domain-containing protein n=2 Tax=Nocardia asteroides TaxID=1824 RepID=U5ELD7_NOCAS|nr:hypothetical protein NCAST_34_03160 [Nocardia asteroides NBRC 15531]
MSVMRTRTVTAALAALLVLASAAACGDDGDKTYYGDERALGNGQIRTYVVTDDGTPTEVGLRIQEAALEGLPMPATMPEGPPPASPPLALPAEADGTVVDHLTFDWVPHGHPPVGMFDKPHFDSHFYFIDPAAVAAIDPQDPAFLTKAANSPDPKYMPAGNATIPEPIEVQAVPAMGVHWVDMSNPVAPGQFTQTLINGAWDGEYIFTEPMFTRDWLLTKPSFTGDIPQPQAYQHSTRYPTTYSIRFDDNAKEYVVSVGGFTERTAS